jgi:hypothetical protein
MNKFKGLSLLTTRLGSFLKATALRRVARDSQPCDAGLFPLNPEALLLVDCGAANPGFCLTTGAATIASCRACADFAASVPCGTKPMRAECFNAWMIPRIEAQI